MISTDTQKIQQLLTRGVDEVIGKEELEKKLSTGTQLRVKLGIDPTSPNLHIGRSVPLLKLRDFQELGHQVVLIIGSFTGQVGDTSDKDSERPMLDAGLVEENMKTYTQQAGKIIDLEKAEIHYNHTWLEKIGYAEIGMQADAFSINEFISRELIQKRLTEGKRVSLRETLYPLMQGYDSVAIRADVELGGSDQRFNMLAGRTLQKVYKQEPQSIITNPLFPGLDGRKMSSSWGNTINILDTPDEMYGKVMSLGDDLIIEYFIAMTRVSLAEIAEYKTQLTSGENPKYIKQALARSLVEMYHSAEEAKKAEQEFEHIFAKGNIPHDIEEFACDADSCLLIDLLVATDMVSSKTDARRMIEQGAVKVNSEKVTDLNYEADVASGPLLQVGKRKFKKITRA